MEKLEKIDLFWEIWEKIFLRFDIFVDSELRRRLIGSKRSFFDSWFFWYFDIFEIFEIFEIRNFWDFWDLIFLKFLRFLRLEIFEIFEMWEMWEWLGSVVPPRSPRPKVTLGVGSVGQYPLLAKDSRSLLGVVAPHGTLKSAFPVVSGWFEGFKWKN